MNSIKSLILIGLAACAGAAVSAHADDASCKPLTEAAAKMARTPYHEVSTVDGKPFEKIYTTKTLSMRVAGKWMTVPVTPQEVLDSQRQTGSYSNCRVLRTDTVEGQRATVYAAHRISPGTSYPNEEDQIWIAAGGLIVKTVADSEKAGHKTHAESQVRYDNVQAPTAAH